MLLNKQEASNLYKESILKLILLIISLSIHLSCGVGTGYEDIYGDWEGESQEEKIIISFSSENKSVLSFNNKESNTVEVLHGNYEIDFSKRPIPLSINNIQELNHSLHTIIRINDDDTSILLNRVKQ